MGQPIAGDERDFPLLSGGEIPCLAIPLAVRASLPMCAHRSTSASRPSWPPLFFSATILKGDETAPRLPGQTFGLTQHGMARLLSLPATGDEFKSSLISSYRLAMGFCTTPVSDRRTTKGVFHLCEDGLPVPADKKSVPRITYLHLLRAALQPPEDLMEVAHHSQSRREGAHMDLTSSGVHVVCPAIPGYIEEKRMEVRFFATGNLVSQPPRLRGVHLRATRATPTLPENDAGVDVRHWVGPHGFASSSLLISFA